ncbi:MAG: amidohydrolase [Rhodospirillales bacterium]|jgi:cytosine/adenosine deaminase-related metal-dependent hydrolase|nr:amidohydrolase [Rhodospirillales bacterium]MDP6774261.1 amidohydrolase [Rhodospirillales bacterium]
MHHQPSRLIVRDALVVTLDAKDSVYDPGDVLIEDGVIVAVGTVEDEAAEGCDRVIDGAGRLLVPGLVNAHTHSPNNMVQGTADGLSHPAYMWITQAYTANRTPREHYVSAMLGCIQMLLTGTTAALDHFPGQTFTAEDVDAVISAYRDAGMRAALGLRFYDSGFDDIAPRGATLSKDVAADLERLNPLKPMPLADYGALAADAISRWHGAEGRLKVFPAPSNPERCTDEALVLCAELADGHDLGMHTHLLESRVQAEIAQEKYGCTMVRHMADLGVLNRRWSFAHTVWVDDDDIELLARSGAVVVHNPESNMKIGAGTAPVPAMKARGVRLALGTDGAGTNDNLIMHEALRLAAMLHRPQAASRADWLMARDVLAMATAGGAAALLADDDIGAIEAGRRADLVLYRLDAPWWVPVNDVMNQLVFAENGSSVDTVMVDGRVLVEGGRITAFDADAILAEARPMMEANLERNAELLGLARHMADLFS